MGRLEENRLKLGKNLLSIREKACLIASNLSKLSEVSESTIFRIEKEKHSFKQESLIKILEVFNITIDEIYNLNIEEYSEQELQRRIEKFRKTYKQDTLSAADLKIAYKKFKGPTYFVNNLIAAGYLDTERGSKEVREIIREVEGVIFKPSEITNCLTSKSYIEVIPDGKNRKKYRVKKPAQYKKQTRKKK